MKKRKIIYDIIYMYPEILLVLAIIFLLFAIWQGNNEEGYQHFNSSRMRWWSWWGLPECGDNKCSHLYPPPYPKPYICRSCY